MKKLFLTICFMFIQPTGIALAEEDNQMYQIGVLIEAVETNLIRLGYDREKLGFGHNGSVDDSSYRSALQSLNDALSDINFLHVNYTNMNSIIIVPSYPLPTYGTTGEKIQIKEHAVMGKTVYLPYHLSTETIRKELSMKQIPTLSEENLIKSFILYP